MISRFLKSNSFFYLASNLQVYGWGRGEHGRLGFGDDKSSKMVPQRVQLLVGENIVQVTPYFIMLSENILVNVVNTFCMKISYLDFVQSSMTFVVDSSRALQNYSMGTRFSVTLDFPFYLVTRKPARLLAAIPSRFCKETGKQAHEPMGECRSNLQLCPCFPSA